MMFPIVVVMVVIAGRTLAAAAATATATGRANEEVEYRRLRIGNTKDQHQYHHKVDTVELRIVGGTNTEPLEFPFFVRSSSNGVGTQSLMMKSRHEGLWNSHSVFSICRFL